jgi:hypothetical protein
MDGGLPYSWPVTTELVGFKYQDNLYCVPDIMVVLGVMQSPKAARVTAGHVKTFVRIYGRQKHMLKNDDPRWEDSQVIPQPVFASDDQWCEHCQERLSNASA